MTEKLYWIYTMTPLHVGAGKGVGFIDLPIMREKVTNWPVVPGSSVKGVLRDYFWFRGDTEQKENIPYAFGQGQLNDDARAGSLVFTDARIVCLPVRSLYGTFAYITCPMVLERLKKDLKAAGINGIPSCVPRPADEEAFHTAGCAIVSNNKVFFEDLDFSAIPSPDADSWVGLLAQSVFGGDPGWCDIFRKRFAIVSDDCFNFLSMTGTEVAAHIKIDDNRKIVADGALWYEESLPVESILAGLVWCDRIPGRENIRPDSLLTCYCSKPLNLQIGGKATVGKGRIQCLFSGG